MIDSSANVASVRAKFKQLFQAQEFAEDGNLEIVNASFIADEPFIFGEVNQDYAERELAWYKSMSLMVNDIPGEVPKIWQQVASKNGEINSNYGWCIWSGENANQYTEALKTLVKNPNSRQAVMIYIRPTMHEDSKRDDMKDFMCTYSVQLLIRKNQLHYLVNMRSNDSWAGYRNDFYWHRFVRDKVLESLRFWFSDLQAGQIHWNCGSLHLYPKNLYLIDHFLKTGKINISKEKYKELYPSSRWGQ